MLKIGYAQIDVKAGNPAANAEAMANVIKKAKASEYDVLIFPEMVIPGYLLGDTWEQASFLKDCIAWGEDIVAMSQDICLIFGNIALDTDRKNPDGRWRKYNALYIAYQGEFITPAESDRNYIIKSLMPNYREFDDTRYFFSNQNLAQELGLPSEALIHPVDLKIKGEKIRLGCMLCEDGWSDDYNFSPMEILCRKYNVDIMVNISASPYTYGKNNKRHRVFAQQAEKYHTPLIYVNNIGIQNNGKTIYTFDGCSTVYDAKGHIISAAPAYEEICSEVFFSREKGLWGREIYPVPAKDDIGNIYEALNFGIRKFLQKIRMNKVVIGVSGGIDSAVAAALYVSVLGPEAVTLINMPSVFNSATTKGLSEELARNLGCRYGIMPIQKVVDYTVKQLEETPLVNLITGEEEHLKVSSFVKENIQARDRSGRILAGVAAAEGAGFTCNANKAETTVGYSTLYGDQSGFLAALADLWKFQVYELAYYLNEKVFAREVIPQGIIDIVPSAELSTAQDVDAGKGDPIKYPYHDYLFRCFVESWQKYTPEDILGWYKEGVLEEKIGCKPGLVKKYFADAKEFIADLERWWNLFTGMAVAKRIQAPPILAVSRRAYGFDHREAQNGPYYTRKYLALKAELLQGVQ